MKSGSKKILLLSTVLSTNKIKFSAARLNCSCSYKLRVSNLSVIWSSGLFFSNSLIQNVLNILVCSLIDM